MLTLNIRRQSSRSICKNGSHRSTEYGGLETQTMNVTMNAHAYFVPACAQFTSVDIS